MRLAFLVDGYNLYHSLKDARRDLDGARTLWLDLRGLCASLLPSISRSATVARVVYFSALAHHLEPTNPGVTARHQVYLRALRATGVEVELGHFKRKLLRCPACLAGMTRFEEKEADVAMGVRLIEQLLGAAQEGAVLLTGDSDLGPAVRTARRLFPDKPVFCWFPYRRGSHELRALAGRSFRLGARAYTDHQLPEALRDADGREVLRPPEW